jgi:hypothetical protein
MTPGPTLEQLIATVRADAGSDDPLAELTTAARTVGELEETADAALAYFVDRCRSNGRSWSEISKALGVTKQAAHKRFSPSAPPLQRLTPRASAVLSQSAAEARGLGHTYIGTEHVLLALFLDPASIAAKILAALGITREVVEQRILDITPRGSARVEAPPYTPRATACLEHTLAEALQLGHNYIGTEHILLALFADPEGMAARILTELDATYDDVRARVIEALSNFTPKAN